MTMFFSKINRLFDDLRKNPRDADTQQKLREYAEDKPVQFIEGFLRALEKTSEKKYETKEPDAKDLADKWRQTWVNTVHKERVQPLLYLTPARREQLPPIIQEAERNGVMVRAVGMGHSFSDVANATDVLVDMLRLNNPLPLETDTLNAEGSALTLYSCEAGMMIDELSADLDKRGLAIPTMAAFDQETIYGAVATSTHGTGIRVPGMTDMIKSMDICSTGGKWYRLEPTNGITDKAKFDAKYSDGSITLIQDDDKFHSSIVAFGMMGIVYSVVIQPVKTFYLRQRLWLSNWSKVKPKLEDRSFFSEIGPWGKEVGKDPNTGEYLPSRAQVFVNPYVTKAKWNGKDGDHSCVVQVQYEISREEYESLVESEPKHPVKLFEFVESILSDGAFGTHVETTAEEDKKETLVEDLGTDALIAFLNTFPEITPTIIDISLLFLLSGSGKIGKSFEVMNQGKLAFKNAGWSVEPGFKVDAENDFIKGTEEIIEVADMSQRAQAFMTSPFCLRFVKASPEYMSPEYGVDTCMIDVPLLLGTIGEDQFLDRMQLDLMPKGARPHWGKVCNMVNGKDLIHKMYPKFGTFLETVEFFNPNGTFNSTFSYRTGMSSIDYLKNG